MSDSITFRVYENPESACARVAAEMAQLLRERANLGRTAVIGLSAARTLLPLWDELIYLHREERLSFRNAVIFNSDEFLDLPDGHPASARGFMHRNLFDHIDIAPGNIHFLSGKILSASACAHCSAYERKIEAAGGIDYQVLGIGRNGRIAFAEPGTPIGSRTHRSILAESSRQDIAEVFDITENVPTHALTLGCGTLLEARSIVLLAWGSGKSRIIRRAVEGPVTSRLPASFLRRHPSARMFLDAAAASLLEETHRNRGVA
jgi:glucosamine-6-phosphate deaminase